MIKLQGPVTIITGDENLRVARKLSPTQYAGGVPIEQNSYKFDLTCNVQPLNGRQLLLVPEMDRYKEQYWVFTNMLQTPVQIKDIVTRNCVLFQIQEIENWGSYQKFRMMRVDVGTEATP